MKTYVKPVLRYEDFQLSMNIAGSCSDITSGNLIPTTTTEPDDGIDFGGTTPSDVYTPSTMPSTAPSAQAACYTNGTTDMKTYNS